MPCDMGSFGQKAWELIVFVSVVLHISQILKCHHDRIGHSLRTSHGQLSLVGGVVSNFPSRGQGVKSAHYHANVFLNWLGNLA